MSGLRDHEARNQAAWDADSDDYQARPAEGTTFNLGYEPRPGPDSTSTYRDAVALAWARRWPAESIWRRRKI